MNPFRALLRFLKNERLLDIAGGITARILPEVWDMVRVRIISMSRPEARGYIRSRAGLCVSRAIEMEIEREKLSPTVKEQLTRLIQEQLLEGIFHQSVAQRWKFQPATMRKAA